MADKAAFSAGRDLPSVAENVELLTGQRGNQLDKAVTYRDLQSLGLATLSRIGSNYKAGINTDLISSPTDIQFPVKPLNVIANGAFNTILIEWDDPNYRGHAYAEVFRAGTDNLSVAVKIGTSSANMYSDPIGGSAKVYYWVRFVNRSNPPVAGPYNSESGTYAETAENIQNILDALQGQIEESHLSQSLLSDIELIPALNTSIQDRAAEIQQITVDLTSLTDRQSQAEAILKAAQDLLGSTTINVSLLHDELNRNVLQYGAEVQSLRNAILSVDPATGEITIDAINVVRSELQTNIDQVTQRVSSVEGLLTQKASSVDVSLQSQRISTVETQMNSINAELTNQVTRAEFTETTEDVTQLTTRMSAAEGSISQKATQQSVDRLGSRVSTAESGLLAVNTDLQSKATQINQIDSAYKAADAANASVGAANSAAITQLSQTVSTANSATSQHLSNIDTSVSGLKSSVTQLQQSSSSTNAETIASSYEQLQARANLAALAAASAALSDDESGRANRVSEASIRKDMTVVANNHEALAQTVEELRANFETTSASLTAQGVNEQTARVTADEALSQTISTLESSYKTADAALSAKVSSEETARASGDLALSSRVDQVVAATGANAAAIQNESTARVNADSAITTLVSTAQAKADSAYALTQTEITNRADADAALSSRIDTTQASVDGASAAIQSEQQARAAADNALSQRVDTVQATANNLTASVQTQSQAISTLQNGAQAMWTVKGQIADVKAGIGLMVDSSGKSQVMVSASQFFVFDPNSAAPTQSLFAVSDGRVVIQKAAIETATIETVTAMKLTADYVKAGISISSPVINGGSLSLGNIYMDSGAAGFGKGGPYGGWGFGWNTIIYQDGSLYTNRLYADSGRFNGEVNASSGTFDNVTINNSLIVRNLSIGSGVIADFKTTYSIRKAHGWMKLASTIVDTGLVASAWWNVDDKVYSAAAGIDNGQVEVFGSSFGAFIANWTINVDRIFFKSRWNSQSTIHLELSLWAEVDGGITGIRFAGANPKWRVFKVT